MQLHSIDVISDMGSFLRTEKLERRYELKSRGFDLKDVQMRVTVLLGVASDRIYSKGRRRDQVEARSLFCYLAVRELGYSITELARRFDMTQPAVGYAVGYAVDRSAG